MKSEPIILEISLNLYEKQQGGLIYKKNHFSTKKLIFLQPKKLK